MSQSVLAKELECLNEVRGEEETSDEGVATIELKCEQVDSFCLVAWLVAEEDFHLVFVVRCTLELPSADVEGLQAAQVSQNERRLAQYESEWERHTVEERQKLNAQVLL